MNDSSLTMWLRESSLFYFLTLYYGLHLCACDLEVGVIGWVKLFPAKRIAPG